jgi:hypothetical protein
VLTVAVAVLVDMTKKRRHMSTRPVISIKQARPVIVIKAPKTMHIKPVMEAVIVPRIKSTSTKRVSHVMDISTKRVSHVMDISTTKKVEKAEEKSEDKK